MDALCGVGSSHCRGLIRVMRTEFSAFLVFGGTKWKPVPLLANPGWKSLFLSWGIQCNEERTFAFLHAYTKHEACGLQLSQMISETCNLHFPEYMDNNLWYSWQPGSTVGGYGRCLQRTFFAGGLWEGYLPMQEYGVTFHCTTSTLMAP